MKNKACPFCGGLVEEHPNPEWRETYKIVRHNNPCYLCDKEYPLNFTLLPIIGNDFAFGSVRLKLWNKRFNKKTNSKQNKHVY